MSDNQRTPTQISLVRNRTPVSALIVLPCSFGVVGLEYTVLPGQKVLTVPSDKLAALYPSRQYEYAKPGDYIGRIRKAGGIVVDFQVSPHHHNMRDVDWIQRVVDIARILKVCT